VTFPIDNRPGPTVLGSPVNAASTRIETLPPLACLQLRSHPGHRTARPPNRRRLIGLPEPVRLLRPGNRRPARPRQPESGVRGLRLRLRLGNPATPTRASATAAWTGSTGDVDDIAPALVMLAQPPRKPMTIAHSAAELPDVA
jgi:hypothetical protein